MIPGSRMPSYGHLFGGSGMAGGEALLDYLDTLVVDDSLDWWEYVLEWEPVVGFEEGDFDQGRRSYANHCAQCHGADGSGGGLVADLLVVPPRNLITGPYRLVPDSLDAGVRRERLAQVIKFGVPGTSMPGHESLTDGEIVDLLAFLESLKADQDQS